MLHIYNTDKIEQKISLSLRELKEEYGASAIKLSTEDAGMSFEQIAYWAQIASPVLPVFVKIGGPEARNDMKRISAIKHISGIIAPMVESSYSLQKYISSLKETFERFDDLSKHINVETITAFENLSQIFSISEISFIDEITIGRGDLSKSVCKEVDGPEVNDMCKVIVEAAQRKNIKVSIGGAVNPKNAERVFKQIKPDKINTRSVVFNRGCSLGIERSILMALEYEILMLKEDLRLGFISKNESTDRIQKLKKRMATAC
jgi:hypothetical protein